MRTLPVLAAALVAASLAPASSAATIQVKPGDETVQGGPRIASDSPGPAFGSTSFQNTDDTAAGSKVGIYLRPATLELGVVTMGDVADIRYWTKGPISSREDFFLHIYTDVDTAPGANNGASWYGRRITHDTNAARTGSGWQQTIVSGFRLTGGTLGDGDKKKFSADNGSAPFGYAGSIADPLPANIADDTVKFFSLQTNSGLTGAGDSRDAQLDGLEITLTDGRSVLVDFAAVPEPASAATLALLAGAGLLRRRRGA